MNHILSVSRSLRPVQRLTQRLTLIGLVELFLIQGIVACDVCLQPPKIPFTTEYPAAIEIAMATRQAIEKGEIDLDPLLADVLAIDRQNPQRLKEVSPQQLIKLWAGTQPARQRSNLRMTVDIVFIDVNKICHLDFRLGSMLYDAGQSEPGEIRLLTTKAGFCRMLSSGFDTCERQELVTIEEGGSEFHEVLCEIFSKRQTSDIRMAQAD